MSVLDKDINLLYGDLKQERMYSCSVKCLKLVALYTKCIKDGDYK